MFIQFNETCQGTYWNYVICLCVTSDKSGGITELLSCLQRALRGAIKSIWFSKILYSNGVFDMCTNVHRPAQTCMCRFMSVKNCSICVYTYMYVYIVYMVYIIDFSWTELKWYTYNTCINVRYISYHISYWCVSLHVCSMHKSNQLIKWARQSQYFPLCVCVLLRNISVPLQLTFAMVRFGFIHRSILVHGLWTRRRRRRRRCQKKYNNLLI